MSSIVKSGMRGWLGMMAALCSLCALPFQSAAAENPTPNLVILTFSGKVEISRREGVWDLVTTNHIGLYVGDRLRTDKNSRATVRLSDGTTMAVGAEAAFLVPEPVKRVNLNPIRGRFFFFHRDKPGDFELRGRAAVAAVRGTEFHLEAGEDDTWLLSVLDGDVLLQSGGGEIDLRSGEAALAKAGEPPRPAVMRRAGDLIQWCLYYPAVVDLNDLALTEAAQIDLAHSLNAYRAGDVRAALGAYPDGRQPDSNDERIYRAALLLAAGQVEETQVLLDRLTSTGESLERLRSLKGAVEELVAVVKGEPRAAPAPGRMATASAWLAESYRLQAESRLEPALEAARRAVGLSTRFALAWARVAELEFSFGHARSAEEALAESLRLAPHSAKSKTLRGFVLAAGGRVAEALAQFDEAIALDGAQGEPWLGRGLCRIRQGRIDEGRQDLIVAASLEPRRSVLRSYLGKAFGVSHNSARARKEFELAENLDSRDPTPWLYSALLLAEENRINEAVEALERSAALNDNRSLFRSRLLLDQDRAARSANLARIYQDAGMADVSVREATRAVESDYGNYSAHLFLANSYDALRDPGQVSLRYETAWLTEYLTANLLAPAQASTLSPLVSQQEYGRLFERNGLGLASLTEYASRGDWLQAAAQHGEWNGSAYAVEETYRSRNGERPNNDQEQLTASLRLKQDLSPADGVFFQAVYYDNESGDLAQYYDPNWASRTLRVIERQEPLLLAGYHHQWSPGVHTLVLAGRVAGHLEQTNASAGTVFLQSLGGNIEYGSYAAYNQAYESYQELYTAEVQQIFQVRDLCLVLGGRYQAGEFDTRSDLREGMTVPGGTPTGRDPITQSLGTDLERVTAYGYAQWRVVPQLLLVGGLAYDYLTFPENYRFAPISPREQTRDQFGPKAGLVWAPGPATTFRGSYTRSLGGVSFDQSFRLEPSQVAGFNQAFRSLMPEAVVGSVNAPELESYGVQFEQRFPSQTYFGISAQRLHSEVLQTVGAVNFDLFPEVPTENPFQPASLRQSLDYNERTLRVALNQLVGDGLSLGVSYRLSRANLDSCYVDLPGSMAVSSPFAQKESLEATLHQVRLGAQFNHSSGFFCGGEGVWTSQDNEGYVQAMAGDSFWQVNLFAGYRFWHRRAEVRAALLNLTDEDYRLNPLNFISDLPRSRTLALSLKFSF